MRRSLMAAVLVSSLATMLAGMPALADQAILTVTGQIGKTNRGPVDAFADALFDKLAAPFDKAYAFTYDELKSLPQVSLKARYENWPAEVSVMGPLLTDVLNAVEAIGETIVVRAVDGYAPEFGRDELKEGQFVLALEANGEPLSIGGRGPVWLVFPPGSMEGQPDTDDGLTWAVFNLDVR